MKREGIKEEDIRLVTFENAITAFGQSGQIKTDDFATAAGVDQSQKFEGNTVLRGGQQPRIDKNSITIQ
jgi:uncharacterized protein